MSERFFYNNDNSRSDFHSVNATDMTAVIALPTGQILELATLSMVSLSTHRDGFPVTALGNVGPKGFTRGHRLAAGTLIFSVFERSAFTKLMNPLEAPQGYTDTSAREKRTEVKSAFFNMHADELPPFDIHMIYTTQEGLQCYEALLGVVIVDQGSVRSMDLIQIQESYAYMATDHIPIQRLEKINTGPTVLITPSVARVVPSHTGAKPLVTPMLPNPAHPPPADVTNYTPGFQAANRGVSTSFTPETSQTDANTESLDSPSTNYTYDTWQDRWEIRSEGHIVVSGFKRAPSLSGWLVTRDTTSTDGSFESNSPTVLTITVPNGMLAKLGDYTATYEDGFREGYQTSVCIRSTVTFSVAPEDYKVTP